jgi:hypothetical protein
MLPRDRCDHLGANVLESKAENNFIVSIATAVTLIVIQLFFTMTAGAPKPQGRRKF